MIRRFLRISRSILEEWTAMFSGRFPPYHKMGIAVALITTAAFSIILSHDVVFEAPVAISISHAGRRSSLKNLMHRPICRLSASCIPRRILAE